MQQIDPGSIDLRHRANRLRAKPRDYALLPSMIERGILSPLIGAGPVDGKYILFDGFKRYRIAKVAGMALLPFTSLAEEESEGVLEFLRRCTVASLNILEQAAFIKHLQSTCAMTVGQIAVRLGRSKAWVSIRRTLLDELSETVRRRVFDDDFPVYAYMYFLRPFMRINEATPAEVDCFVEAVSGKDLSTREIERLAYGYFRGPAEFRSHIEQGEILWALKRSQGLFRSPMLSCGAAEVSMLQSLERLDGEIGRIGQDFGDQRLGSASFFAQAGLLAARLLERLPVFIEFLGEFHDRSRNAQSGVSSSREGCRCPPDQPAAAPCPQHGQGDHCP